MLDRNGSTAGVSQRPTHANGNRVQIEGQKNEDVSCKSCVARNHTIRTLYTGRQNELFLRLGKLFYESSTGVPALLPCSQLPRQARGTLRK